MRLSNAPIEQVVVASIVEGVRRRKSLGNIRSLMRSIEEHGLIHPIVIRNGHELVVGGRRLEAFRRLGKRTIPARHIEDMADEELRALELAENTERLALSDFETSRARLAQIRQAEADRKQAVSISLPVETKKTRATTRAGRKTGKGRGRPKEPGSKRDVEHATGISPVQQVKVERHVALAEAFPFLQRAGWVQHSVLAAGEQIQKLPDVERPKVASLLDQDGIPPQTAIKILSAIVAKPVSERRKIWEMAESDDAFVRKQALTQAANQPPEPDPALIELGQAQRTLTQAARVCRTQIFRPRIKELAAEATRLHTEFSAHHRAG